MRLGRIAAEQFECLLRVTSVALCDRWLPIDFRYAPFATEVMRRCKMTRRANKGQNPSFAHRPAEGSWAPKRTAAGFPLDESNWRCIDRTAPLDAAP
jgi:hypothetical protein